MFVVKKQLEIAGAHHLLLSYDSPCQHIHGHNWKITIYCGVESAADLQEGMVIDFATIKRTLQQFDHKDLNKCFPLMNPTAENMAQSIQILIPYCFRVDIQESEGNTAIYVAPNTNPDFLLVVR